MCAHWIIFLALLAQTSISHPSRDEYDFIIAGGGTAGLTVADRLTQAFPNRSVLVVEYGGIATATPGEFEPPASPPVAPTFDYVSLPIAALNNRRASLSVGKTLGGSSAVNGQFFDRGSRHDYDQWAALNAESDGGIKWDWAGLLPYFRKSVTFVEPAAEEVAEFGYTSDERAHGGSTPIYSSFPPFQWPTALSSRRAWQEAGVAARDECAGGDKDGLCWVPTSQYADTAKRSHSGIGHYLDVIASRPNYHLLTSHKVTRILQPANSCGQIRGVEIRSLADNSTFTLTARLEVILSAGAIHTPQILQRSGIGPRSLLESAGIDVLVDLPGVGYNFQDHAGPYFGVGITNDLVPNIEMLTTDPVYLQQSIDEYNQLPAQGPYTLADGNTAAYLPLQTIAPTLYSNITSRLIEQLFNVNTTAELQSYLPAGADKTVLAGYVAQLSQLAATLSSPSQPVMEALQLSAYPNSSVPQIGFHVKPLSRGSVLIDPLNLDGEPILTYGTASNPLDLDIMATFIALFRKVWNAPSLAILGVVETAPGPHVQSEEEILAWLRDGVLISALHPCGTAAMMPREKGGVVATDLTVYGVTGLRVVDMSIAPLIPGTHLSATAYAIAEKASDIIISHWS